MSRRERAEHERTVEAIEEKARTDPNAAAFLVTMAAAGGRPGLLRRLAWRLGCRGGAR